MRVLHLAHHAYVDPASGAAHSVRSMMEILAKAGHVCSAVASGRFDLPVPGRFDEVHDALGVHVRRDRRSGPRTVHRYRLNDVDVVAVDTRHPVRNAEDEPGGVQLGFLMRKALAAKPDLVLAYGSHPLTFAALKAAKEQGARTVFTLHNWGYSHAWMYRHVDRVLSCSKYCANVYADRHGVHGEGIASPVLRESVLGDPEGRGFVAFVNPLLIKGAAPFARLADMLGRYRPDIPMLVVQGRSDVSILAAIPELDLARHEQILVSPPIPEPRQIWSLARIVLMPTINEEPFGRVAAEALVNGVPIVASDRGGLPEAVDDGGIVLPLPDSLSEDELVVPSEAEMRPWFDAITTLWDDEAAYERVAAAGRAAAARLYDDDVVARRYLAYFEDPGPFPPVLGPRAS